MKVCTKIQFWQNPNIFTSFSPNFFFWQFFSRNQSCHVNSYLKSPNHNIFTSFSPRIMDNFFGKSKMKISNSVLRRPFLVIDKHCDHRYTGKFFQSRDDTINGLTSNSLKVMGFEGWLLWLSCEEGLFCGGEGSFVAAMAVIVAKGLAVIEG